MSKSKAAREQRHVLTDPRAIKALAHPARLAVLDALTDGVELTATECAAVAGISPSAMSYHLRALEKWGLVQRAASSGDGRERPWRAVEGGWSIEALPDPAATAATNAVLATMLDRLRSELTTWFDREREQPKTWRDAASVQNGTRWLTPAEVTELRRLYEDFIDARRARTAADHPDGARRVRLCRVLVPLQYE